MGSRTTDLVKKDNDLPGQAQAGRPPKIKRTIKRTSGLSAFFNLSKWKAGFKFQRDVVVMEEEIER
jgi:hypothetical protein